MTGAAQVGDDLADEILGSLPPRNNFGELLARLNRDVAQLNAHYDNTRWLDDSGEGLEEYTVDKMSLTLDVAGRRFKLDAGEVLHITHLGEMAKYLQDQETATGMGKIINVAASVREIYDLVFPREADAAEGGDAGAKMQQVPPGAPGE